ncbi:MAG: hypothetical protein ACM3ME_03050 [Chloroflexota bacterium]
MTCNKLNLATLALVLVMLSFAIVSTAQSVGTVAIFLKSGDVRFGTIQQAGENNTIRLVNDCGIYNIPHSEIDSIKDLKTTLKREEVYTDHVYDYPAQVEKKQKEVYTIKEKGFYNISSVALLFGQGQNGFLPIPSLSTVNGWQFNKHIYTGLGIGYEYYDWSVLPVFAEVKYMADFERIIPFGSLKLGYAFPISKPVNNSDNYGISEYNGGVQLNPEVGLRFVMSSRSSFMFSLGYHFQQLSFQEKNYYWWNENGYETTVHTDYNRISIRAGFMF